MLNIGELLRHRDPVGGFSAIALYNPTDTTVGGERWGPSTPS